jgi:hypothetical protein
MKAWLTLHWMAFANTVAKLGATPFATLLNVLVIGVALALPAGAYTLLVNLQQAARNVSSDPEFSAFLSLDVKKDDIADLDRRLRALLLPPPPRRRRCSLAHNDVVARQQPGGRPGRGEDLDLVDLLGRKQAVTGRCGGEVEHPGAEAAHPEEADGGDAKPASAPGGWRRHGAPYPASGGRAAKRDKPAAHRELPWPMFTAETSSPAPSPPKG